jgi:poly [ADP-ribose] polymerase
MSKIELASTGRASCRACRKPIAKGELRFGEEIGSAGFDGSMTLWFHLTCAAAKRPEQLRPVLAKWIAHRPGARSASTASR